MIKRRASAAWQGDLKDGKGTISSASGVLEETPYSFGTRFEDAKGTNPEELIGAAHAGCFSMALANIAAKAGHPAERIATEATVSFEKTDAGFTITTVHLAVRGRVEGIDPATFEGLANEAKANCPVSRVLNATITMEAALES